MFRGTKNILPLLIILTLLGGILHFFNLNWGAPYYFHPDERNIASAISQLNFPSQMNPHFFAYGSLPIYVIYFTGLLANYSLHLLQPTTHNPQPTFDQAIIISRFYSALFATLLIPLLFLIGKKIKDQKTGLITAFLTTTSVGFIQFSHFGTFEMWLTFFTTVLFYLCLQLPKRTSFQSLALVALTSGTLVAIKISHLAMIPLILLAISLQGTYQNIQRHHIYKFWRIMGSYCLFILLAGTIYFLTNPYVLRDATSFLSTMQYESSVALGTLPVFYTGEFLNSIPVFFQFQNIYPFLLNPLITLIFIASFIYLIYKIIKTKSFDLFLLISFFLALFLSQAFLFVKWTRYMIPTLPFIYLIIAVALNNFFSFNKKILYSKHYIFGGLVFICSVFALSYFITTFMEPDTRIAARNFSQNNIPSDSPILSEVYDLGITPFNNNFGHIELFNFYDLEPNSLLTSELEVKMTASEYIILPSQRILKTRLAKKEQFPKGYEFYEPLTSGRLAYKQIYISQCSIFCKITYLGSPVFQYEQTASVFDRPTVMIFQKIK